MKDVMLKAQELAEAIKESSAYLKMKELEDALLGDPEATEAVNNLARKRQQVEDLLSSKGMDPETLKRANQEMIQAEAEMNGNETVARLKAARKEFTDMMDSVNRVLRVVITGEIREEDVNGKPSGCSGNCSGCSGCG